MKMIKTLVIATVLSVLTMGSASALTLQGISSPAKVNITVKDGVATLFGNVDTSFEKNLAGKAAAELEGVERVNNLLMFSN